MDQVADAEFVSGELDQITVAGEEASVPRRFLGVIQPQPEQKGGIGLGGRVLQRGLRGALGGNDRGRQYSR